MLHLFYTQTIAPLRWRGGSTTDIGSSAGSDVRRTEDSVQVGSLLSPAVMLSDHDDGGGSGSSSSDVTVVVIVLMMMMI